MKSNIFLYIFFILILSSCSSNQKQINDLEDKISKLTDLLESKSQDAKDEKKEEPEVKIEAPVVKLTLPKIKEVRTESIKRKIILGEKEDKHFQLHFDSNNYWLIIESNGLETLDGIVIMNITREDKSPESINFFQIQEGVFQAYGEHIQGKVELEIRFNQQDKQPIVFIVEAEL